MSPHWSETEIEQVATCLKAVAQPLRLGIVCLLAESPRSVNEICAALDASQPNVSQHLARMHAQSIVRTKKNANRVYYSLVDPRLTDIIGILRNIYCP